MDNKYFKLGEAYGIMARALPQVIGTPAKVSSANIRPVVGLATGMHLLLTNRAMTPAIDRAIRDVLNDVDVDSLGTSVVTLEDQGYWINGFYSGSSKKPLNDGEYMAQARSAKELSQEDVATALGVTKSAVSQWESSARSIPKDKKALIEELLDIRF